MLEAEKIYSDFLSWDGDLESHKNDKFDFWVHLSTPFGKNLDGKYVLSFKWKILFHLLPTYKPFFESIHETQYIIKFTEDPPTKEDFITLCKKAYTLFTIAYLKKTKEEVYKPPRFLGFPDSAFPIINNLYEAALRVYSSLQ